MDRFDQQFISFDTQSEDLAGARITSAIYR
jgi:hypothetical protein